MNNKHQELIEEKVSEFDSLFAAGLIPKHKYDVQGKEIRFFIEKTLQATIDTVLKEERKRVNNNIELLACKVDERRMGAHGREIIKLKTLDKTPPDKV